MQRQGKTVNFLKPLRRGFPIIVLAVALFVFVASRYLRYSTPQYESTVKIKLADSKEGIPNSNLYKDFDVFATNNKIGAEIELLKSPLLAEKVVGLLNLNPVIYRVGEIHKMELYNESPLLITTSGMAKGYVGTSIGMEVKKDGRLTLTLPDGKKMAGTVGAAIHTGKGDIVVNYNKLLLASRPGIPVADKYEFVVQDPLRLAKAIAGAVDVTSVDKDIPILRISFKSAVAAKSADIVNTLASVYINDYIEEKFRSADTTESFLASQLAAYGKKLAASESAIRNYRDGNNIINIHQETETDLRKIADLKKQLASVKMELEAIDTLNLYIGRNKDNFTNIAPNFEAFTDLLSTEMVKQIKTLQAEKRDLLMKYTPQHEKVKVVDRKIQDLADYMVESINNTAHNLQIKHDNLVQTITSSESEFEGLPDKERNMTILERNFGMNEQIYRFLQGKETEASIAKTATISFHRIIARGEVPSEPVSPVKKLIYAFSGFLGLLFSIIGIYAVHSVKARVDNENVISRQTDIPIESSIPFADKPADRKFAFNRWVLELDLKRRLNDSSTICISSNKEREGKTFVAEGLAEAIAGLGKKTLLVVMDRQVTQPKGLCYDVSSPFNIFSDWKVPAIWEEIMCQWKGHYDAIVIENSKFFDDNSSIIPIYTADMNFFVVDSRLTRIKELPAIDELKERLALKNISIVLNRAGYIPNLFAEIKGMLTRRSKKTSLNNEHDQKR